MGRETDNGLYTRWSSLSDLTREDLQDCWGRRNKLVIVKVGEGKRRLVFLVEDVENPHVPGYPVSSIEYFDNQHKAVQAIKETLKTLGYQPAHQEYGFFSSRRLQEWKN